MAGNRSQWLLTTVNAVREVVTNRLARHDLDRQTEREMEMALELIETIWQELVGQAGLAEREHERFVEFFEFAPDALAVTDVGCNLREANRSLAELLGVPQAALLGTPLTRHIAEADRAAFLIRFVGHALHAEDKPVTWRSRLQPASGAPIEVTISVLAIQLHKSGVGGLCWLFRPI